MEKWDARQYLKFEQERTQPAVDLAARIPLKEPLRIIDIGCGPGNSTSVLKNRYPNAEIIGADKSLQMLETARKACPDCHFIHCDLEQGLPSRGTGFDLVFSNACIQWIPNHPKLLAGLMQLLNKNGVLAVQVPMNQKEPIHKMITEITTLGRWSRFFERPRIFYTLKDSEYFDLLSEMTADVSIWTTTYYHCLDSHEAILDWYRGTGLRPYLSVLNPKQQMEFEEEIRCRLREAYKVQKNGQILFRFPRLFFIAQKR